MSAAAAQVGPAQSPNKPAFKGSPRPRRPNYNHIHRNLLPIEVYPLPTLIPHNPLSLLAIALSYLTQVLSPPSRPTYNGYFSSATSSIHITDAETIRTLWEMGFFGKGSLSRSEPNWLEAQRKKGSTAEENTGQRREERRKQKLERARLEQEIIDQELCQEVELRKQEETPANDDLRTPPSTGLSLNLQNGDVLKTNAADISDIASVLQSKDEDGSTIAEQPENDANGTIHGYEDWKRAIDANGIPTPPLTSTSSEASQAECRPVKKLQRQKTVRFSPTIEAREFDLSSPVISPIKSPGSSPTSTPPPEAANREADKKLLEQQEHLQLSLEEAFFLSYSLGVLQVYCDDSDTVLPPTSLFSLFRRHSYQPPRSLSMSAEPDDPFILSYVVYHHYRSLGWVVRSGVKFAVDYLLYNRGPAFSHAEFAIMLVPSFTHPYWSEHEDRRKAIEGKTRKSWWWLHGINRVQAQVKKQLILCYVDIPPPLLSQETDIAKLLSRYRLRDVSIRRWSPNRTRD